MAVYRTNPKSNPIRRIEAELRPGEVLLWTGAPIMVFRFPRMGTSHASCLRMLVWFIIWMIVASVTVGVLLSFINQGLATFISFFGIFFIWQFVRMWTINPIQRANRYYAITNRRAIIVARRGRRAPRSLKFEAIEFLAMRRDRTGAGTIDCFVPGHPDFDYVDDEHAELIPGPLFEYIADPDTALALLTRLSKKVKSS